MGMVRQGNKKSTFLQAVDGGLVRPDEALIRKFVETVKSAGHNTPDGEGKPVDWQEKYFEGLENDIDEIKDSIALAKTEIRQDINNQMLELRDRDGQRHSEIMNVLQHQESKAFQVQAQLIAVNERVDKKLGELSSDIKNSDRWVKGLIISVIALTITAIGAFGAITYNVISFISNASKAVK